MISNNLLHVLLAAGLSGLVSSIGFLLLLPTKIGERLLSNHFDAKIEALKHEQGKELGRLQAELDHFKDRGIRSNEKEYQAITALWESFVDAFLATRGSVAQLLEYPDLNKLSPDDVADFLEDENITGKSAARILSAGDRNSSYNHTVRAKLIWVAGETVLRTIAILRKQSVFMPEELAGRFSVVLDDLNAVRIEQQLKMRKDLARYITVERSLVLVSVEGQKTFDRLRDAVRNRLLWTLEN